ncbi:RpnC/YadD family protein [Streptomyces sp. YIM S03343]
MVSSPHEAMHRIFQDHPGLFSGVSAALGVHLAVPASVTLLPTDLTENRPLERRVDTLLRFDAEDEEDSFVLAVEAQSGKDLDKPASWAYYASYLLAKYGVQPVLLVVCQDRATAEWAARPSRFGPREYPLLTLCPLVAGPHNMPVIITAAEARKDLALATLSAITHAKNPDIETILKAMSTALRETPSDVAAPIIELISQGMGSYPAAETWSKLVSVDLSFYKSPISQEIRAEGREQGLEQGRAEGEVLRAAADVLDVFDVRSMDVPETVRERILDCDDLETLRHWLRRAVIVPTAEDIFTGDVAVDE